MNRYVIGDIASGEILRSAVCDQSQLDAQVQPGEVLDLSDAATAETHYFSAGVVTAYTADQAARKRDRPGETSGWSNEAMAWGINGDIASRRAAKWATIKTERTRRITAPKTTSVGTFDADADAIANLANVIALTQLAVARGMPGTARYTLADNVRQVLTLEQMQTAALEMGAQVQSIFDQADTLRTAIDAASAADLAGIDWPPA